MLPSIKRREQNPLSGVFKKLTTRRERLMQRTGEIALKSGTRFESIFDDSTMPLKTSTITTEPSIAGN